MGIQNRQQPKVMKPAEQEGCKCFLPLSHPMGITSLAHKHYFIEPYICSYFTFHSIKNPDNSFHVSTWQADALPSSNLLLPQESQLAHFSSKAWFYYSAQRPAYNVAAWWKFSTTLEQPTWQPSFMGTHILHGIASSIRMTPETLITNMPARPGAHMLWTKGAEGHWDGTSTDVRGCGGEAPLLTPSLLLFYCSDYLSRKAFVHTLYETSIFIPL